MKKVLLFSLIGLLLAPALVLAQADPTPPFATGITGISGILGLIDTIASWIFWILIAIATIMVVLAGLQFVTSGGKPDSATEARMKIIYAIVGVAVAFLAKALVWVATTLVA